MIKNWLIKENNSKLKIIQGIKVKDKNLRMLIKTKFDKIKVLTKINRAEFKAISFFRLIYDLDLVPLKMLRL